MQLIKQESIRQNKIITLGVRSLDSSNAHSVSKELVNAMRGQSQVVVDLGELRYFDVNGFAAMLRWVSNKEASEVRICSESGKIQALFELLRAETMIPIFQNREDALASFRRPDKFPVNN